MNNGHENHGTGDHWPSNATAVRRGKGRGLQALVLTATLIAASVAGCAPVGTGGPRDVGNMAYPDPLPQGNLDTVTVSGRQPRDVGNMAYPEPLPQGNLSTTRLSCQTAWKRDPASAPKRDPLWVGLCR